MFLALPTTPQSVEVHGDDLALHDCHSHHDSSDHTPQDNSKDDKHNCHDKCHMACCHITLTMAQTNHFQASSLSKYLTVQFLFKIGPPKNISFKLFRPPIRLV